MKTLKLYLAAAILILGTSLFWMGFHNVDLAWNAVRLGGDGDCNLSGCVELGVVYMRGLFLCISGIVLFGIIDLWFVLDYIRGQNER